MHIAVFGTGAVGGYFGGRLQEAGHDVHFVARGAVLDALRRDGLHLESEVGDLHLGTVNATDRASEVGPVDVIVVGLKAWHIEAAAQEMAALIGDDTMVLPLQNGIEVPDLLCEALGREHVLGGLCKIISMQTAPGHIRQFGPKPMVALGELPGGVSARAERLGAALRDAGVVVSLPENIRVAMWEKFLFITAYSSVAAVARVTVGEMRSTPETRALVEEAFTEIAHLADACGVTLADDIVSKTMAFLDGLPADGTSSMQRDLAAGQPSELDAQTGAVVRLANRVGIPVPVHRVAYQALRASEARAQPAG